MQIKLHSRTALVWPACRERNQTKPNHVDASPCRRDSRGQADMQRQAETRPKDANKRLNPRRDQVDTLRFAPTARGDSLGHRWCEEALVLVRGRAALFCSGTPWPVRSAEYLDSGEMRIYKLARRGRFSRDAPHALPTLSCCTARKPASNNGKGRQRRPRGGP